jgi:processive 1,2-diacylglycerol beta-glucosyltransferase
MWLSRAFHRYFVALDETQAFLETLGLPSERITVSGIPITPDFDLTVDKAEECWQLGLNPDKPILLLSAGAIGAEPTAYMVERLMALTPRAQLVVVCGRNEILRRHILKMTRNLSDQIKVLGYCNEMYKLMRIADILIAKPGGLTASEALVTGLPLCIVNPIPGQEERNSDHLLEAGVAVKCHDLNTLAFKIERLLDRPDQLSEMRIRALRFAKPNAARTIVDTLLSDELPPLALSRKERQAMTQSTYINDL